MAESDPHTIDIPGPGMAPAGAAEESTFVTYFLPEGVSRRRHFLRLLGFQTLWLLALSGLAMFFFDEPELHLDADRITATLTVWRLFAWPVICAWIMRFFLDLAFPGSDSPIFAAASAAPFLSLMNLGTVLSFAASLGMFFCAAVSYLAWRRTDPRWGWWSGVLLHACFYLPPILFLLIALP